MPLSVFFFQLNFFLQSQDPTITHGINNFVYSNNGSFYIIKFFYNALINPLHADFLKWNHQPQWDKGKSANQQKPLSDYSCKSCLVWICTVLHAYLFWFICLSSFHLQKADTHLKSILEKKKKKSSRKIWSYSSNQFSWYRMNMNTRKWEYK